MTRGAYYNEFDPYAAAWLRNLIAAGHIAPGDVDDRSIADVSPDDLKEYTQAHFFAGIGVWSHALRLAGWPDDLEVWTGSCPCQPFSAAGKRRGFADERHIWPVWFRLITERRPRVIFGEQVSHKSALPWLDAVCADLEGAKYAIGALDICAPGVGAPHLRQRTYFVAESDSERCEGSRIQLLAREPRPAGTSIARRAAPSSVADTDGGDAGTEGLQRSGEHRQLAQDGVARILADGTLERRRESCADLGWLASGDRPQRLATGSVPGGHVGGFWRDADWLYCRDEKYRPVESGTFPLAHGAPARVGRLRAYGNAIVGPLAQAFIEAYLDCRP